MTTSRLGSYPYQITDREQLNLLKTIDCTQISSIPEIWPILAAKCGSVVCLKAPYSQPAISLTYQEVANQIQLFAAGLQSLGIQPGRSIALFADNSPRLRIKESC
jgi:long-chain acyl-CoA synthetase